MHDTCQELWISFLSNFFACRDSMLFAVGSCIVTVPAAGHGTSLGSLGCARSSHEGRDMQGID